MADVIAPAKKITSRWHTSKNVERLIFSFLVAPAVAMVTIFILFPVGTSVFYSFYQWNGLGPLTKFIGLNNFATALADDLFWNALKNNGIIIVFSILIQLPIAFLLADIISRKKTKLMVFFRAVCFLPYIL
jgi:raffinose/stachyose/melibiose transport system permease protein